MTEKLKGLFGGGESDETTAPAQQQAAPMRERGARRGGGRGEGGRGEGRRGREAGGGRREGRGGGGGRRRMTAEEAERAQDYIARYTTGNPSEGFTPDEAIAYLRQMHGRVPPEVMQRAAVSTVQNLPEDQRKAFAEMLQRRQQGTGMVTIERTGQAHAAEGRGVQAGSADVNDVLGSLFGTLMGGGATQPMPQPAPSGGPGPDDMLGGLLGTLLGAETTQRRRRGGTSTNDPFGDLFGSMGTPASQEAPQQRKQQDETGGGLGDILSSPLGKAVLGGIAAFAMKEMMDKARKG